MGLAGKALIAIWNDIAPEMREDFFEWHPREHMVERLGITGFLRGRRCVAVQAQAQVQVQQEFLTLYELTDTEVLTSEIYKHRLTHPTPWSTRTLPAFRNNVRGACRVHFSEGYAMGGFIQTLRLSAGAEPGDSAALMARLRKELLPGLIERPRITGVHLVQNDVSLTAGNAGNQRGRMITLPDIVVLVEGSTADGVRAVCAESSSAERLRSLGAAGEIHSGLYQLEYSIQNLAS